MDRKQELPEDYREVMNYDIRTRRKDALMVNLLTILLFILMCIIGILLLIGKRPLPVLELSQGKYLAWMFTVLFFILLHMAAHMWIHGRMMQYFSGEKPFYGYCGFYLYTGCDAFFTRRDYLVIVMAPFVINGVLLLVLTWTLSPIWSPAAYIVQIFNVSMSARDFVAANQVRKQPEDALIRDTGMKFTVYSGSSGYPV